MARRVLHGGCVGRSLSTNTLRGRRITENLRGKRPHQNSITSMQWWLSSGRQKLSQLKSHVTPYKFNSSHWLKLQHSDWKANLVKDFF